MSLVVLGSGLITVGRAVAEHAVDDEGELTGRVLNGLRKRAQSLGFDLVQADTGLVLE